MYHTDPIINDIMLTIINDGNGSECGMTYEQRKAAADTGIFEFRLAVRNYNRRRHSVYGSPMASRQQVLEAATLIQAYYREHIKECA